MATSQLLCAHESWVDLPSPTGPAHGVQFYEEDGALCDAVAQYLAVGIAAGEPTIAIVTAAHARAIRARLPAAAADDEGRMPTFLDAHDTLESFMVGALPDPELFERTVGRVVAEHAGGGRRKVRAFGEMVDLLWRAGNSQAAIRLEELWGELASRHSFSLLCAYVMDDFLEQAGGEDFRTICSHHSHAFRPDGRPHVEGRDSPADQLEELRQRADALEAEVEHRKRLEVALRDALCELRRSETALRESRLELERALEDRGRSIEQLQENVRFSELFVGILGHDLRNPLMAIGTAAALLERRNDAGNCTKPIVRIQSSARRMSRMIDQILDFTRLRIGGGFPLKCRGLELPDVFRAVLDELETTETAGSVWMDVRGDASGTWDDDRLCQLVSNLVGNALQHRSPGSIVRIRIDGTGRDEVVVRFGNEGVIEPELLSALFEPFHGNREKKTASSGLGLGLFISQQIADAHGGRILVESSATSGTCFTLVLPRHAGVPRSMEEGA